MHNSKQNTVPSPVHNTVQSAAHSVTKNSAHNPVALADIIKTITATYADTQAIYLYGTWGTEYQRADSDIDVAVLLPHRAAQQARADYKKWWALSAAIGSHARTDCVDLVNLRCVDTSFQAEIISSGRVIYCADDEARIVFETLILGMHQKLNEERQAIREQIMKDCYALS